MKPRPPVVTILGHVDHGKTSLLDYIRKSRIAAREHGGITQRIGAYEIETGIKGYPTSRITFIDTPGHEAFSKLRARGANVADIAILIIDAKDSLMPQTIESIAHIKNAKIPVIVAINKMDLPDANPDKVKSDLLKYEIATEDRGGNVPVLPISAKTGQGVNELLETILLLASEKSFQFNPEHDPQAYIIEVNKDKRGVVASIVMKDGTLRIGDTVYAEDKKAKIKAMTDDLGIHQVEIFPSSPAEVLGFTEMPEVGALITKTVGETRAVHHVEAVPVDDPLAFLQEKPEDKRLSVIVKADSQGSLEAITSSLAANENITIALAAVGDVYRSDVFLAKTTQSIIVGFSTRMDAETTDLAKQEKVIIKTYSIIYELLEELQEVSDLLKEKELAQKNLKGEARILATFIIEGEKIYGVKIVKGKINLADQLEVHQDNTLIGKTKLVSLKIRAKAVQEVKKDQEAGMVFSPPLDMKVGTVVKSIL